MMAESTEIINPERLAEDFSTGLLLSEIHVSRWRNEGYLLLDGVFSSTSIQAALEDIKHIQMSKKDAEEFEVGDGKTFPTSYSGLDTLTLDSGFVNAITQLLGVCDIRMSQAETWKKVALTAENGKDNTFSNQDQRMHMDFPNHTLVHPPLWDSPEAVAVIIYLSEGKECGGATRVVPKQSYGENGDELYQWPYFNMPGIGEIPWKNDRASVEAYLHEHHPEVASFREKLYAREKEITYSPGTVLFYRHDLWHRGTPLLAGAERFVQNLVFKKAQCDWVNNWNRGTAYSMYSRDQYVEKMIARMSVQQRSCLGFPPPGSAYWTEQTVEAVQRRYGVFGMDITPYAEGLAHTKSSTIL